MENFENEAKQNLNFERLQINQNNQQWELDMEDCIEDVDLDLVSGGLNNMASTKPTMKKPGT
jgi:TATA-binding protein-associated factor Taf7